MPNYSILTCWNKLLFGWLLSLWNKIIYQSAVFLREEESLHNLLLPLKSVCKYIVNQVARVGIEIKKKPTLEAFLVLLKKLRLQTLQAHHHFRYAYRWTLRKESISSTLAQGLALYPLHYFAHNFPELSIWKSNKEEF